MERKEKQDDFVKKFNHTVLSHAHRELFYEVFIESCIL